MDRDYKQIYHYVSTILRSQNSVLENMMSQINSVSRNHFCHYFVLITYLSGWISLKVGDPTYRTNTDVLRLFFIMEFVAEVSIKASEVRQGFGNFLNYDRNLAEVIILTIRNNPQ